jgi:hypothetical protein
MANLVRLVLYLRYIHIVILAQATDRTGEGEHTTVTSADVSTVQVGTREHTAATSALKRG